MRSQRRPGEKDCRVLTKFPVIGRFHLPTVEEHCHESEILFGAPFCELHIWLDAFAGQKGYGMRHRKVRHHLKGIQEAVELFGSDAEAPARQHIVSDLRQEGWTAEDPFPQDEADYVRIGFF